MVRRWFCFPILFVSFIQVEAYGTENQPPADQGGYGARIAPPPAPQLRYPPSAAHQPRESHPAKGGYGTIPPPSHAALYPPPQPPCGRRPCRHGESGGEAAREKTASSESSHEKSRSSENGGNHGGFESARGTETERYTAANPSININIGGGKEPMAPSFGPESPKEGSSSEGVRYDEKTGKGKLASFFGDSDARNRDRPLEPSKSKKQNVQKATIEENPEETKVDCSVQPNNSPPKCNWKSEPQHHLNLWPNNMVASICESLVKSPVVCQSMCEREPQCQSIHYCPHCIDHNCRLISEKPKGKNGLKLVQDFKFVDYYEKSGGC